MIAVAPEHYAGLERIATRLQSTVEAAAAAALRTGVEQTLHVMDRNDERIEQHERRRCPGPVDNPEDVEI